MNYVSEFLTGTWLQQAKEYLSNSEKMKELLKSVTDYVGKEGLSKVKDKLVLMYNFVADVISGDYKDYSLSNLAIIVAALIYVVSPLDLVPDIIPIVGLVDDATIVIWAVGVVNEELAKYEEWKNKQ